MANEDHIWTAHGAREYVPQPGNLRNGKGKQKG